VYIIDEVHMLTREAFNALLKILEEPPEHLLFILATTELHKVPATILSRCQRFAFKRILPRDMERQLMAIAKSEGINLTGDGAELLSRMANGALRDALSLLDQCRAAGETVDSAAVLQVLGLAGSVQTVQLMRCALERRAADALALFDKLYRDGKDVAALLGELSDLGRELTMMKAAPDGARALLMGLYDTKMLLELTADTPIERFLFMTETLQRCCATLGDSTRPRTDAELCLLRLCNESLCGDLNALAARVASLEEGGVTVKTVVSAPAPAPKAASVPVVPEVPIETRYEEPPMPEEYGERVFASLYRRFEFCSC
jgi:DNA polymerase-3 subunit gamma/tau